MLIVIKFNMLKTLKFRTKLVSTLEKSLSVAYKYQRQIKLAYHKDKILIESAYDHNNNYVHDVIIDPQCNLTIVNSLKSSIILLICHVQ